MNEVLVLDTTAIAALYIDGPLTSATLKLVRRATTVTMPLRWRTEFRNVLLKHMRGGPRMSLDEAARAHRRAVERFAPLEQEPETREVLQAAEDLHLGTTYDAEFAALARELGGVVVTNDGELADRL